MLRAVLDALSTWTIPVLLAGIPLLALLRRVKVYPAFLDGARQGFETAVRIIPALVAVFVLLAMLRASGAMDAAARALGPLTRALGVPPSVLPVALVRPLSGGAAQGIVADVLRTDGPDSFAGRLASVMAGSTETTFYVLAVYMGAAGVSRYRQALAAGLLADLAGFAAAIAVCRLLFGG
ncbi:MAG TPA: nucleoside recognition domain-containing protein [Anaeromyxobacter sp.]|nr:nucleoside recognition domain-containing protein [Anaeromyxobacter sp.]